MIESQVCRDGSSFRLEHHGCLSRSDPPQQLKFLVREPAAGRVVPELKTLAVHFADAVRQLKPGVAWKGVRLESCGMNVEDRSPLAWDPRVLPSAARLTNDSGHTRGPLVRDRCVHARRYPEHWAAPRASALGGASFLCTKSKWTLPRRAGSSVRGAPAALSRPHGERRGDTWPRVCGGPGRVDRTGNERRRAQAPSGGRPCIPFCRFSHG
jgi:hypothetical protein